MLLQANGRPYEEPDGGGLKLPSVVREPPSWQTGTFSTVDACADAAACAYNGWFQYPSWLIEQTLRTPRARGPMQTRLNGLTGTEIQWVPGRDNDIGRRAVKAIQEDWSDIASAAARYQLTQWGLLLGVGFAQKHWYWDSSKKRRIPRLEVWHPQWATWDSALNNRRGAYRIWTLDGWQVVPSPALTVPGEEFVDGLYDRAPEGRWLVHEPFGTQSYRQGLIHALWASALGWQFADDDMSALCERQGLGGFLLKYPKTTDAKGADGRIDPNSSLGTLMRALTRLGRKFVLPVEQYPQQPGPNALASYGVEPFEWSGVGFDIVKGTKASKAEDMGVLILGHNTTVSSTTAGASAGANVGNLIRGDLRLGDCLNESITFRSQIIAEWAARNYGDPGYAPVPIYITDSPLANEPAARTMLSLAQAIEIYRRQGVPDEALVKLLSLFQFDVKALGPVVQPKPPQGQAPQPKRPESDKPQQENAA